MDQMLGLPKTFWCGILFQLMVFILARGTGVSCWGSGLMTSIGASGVFGRASSLALTERRFGAGGAGGTGGPPPREAAGPPAMSGGGGGGAQGGGGGGGGAKLGGGGGGGGAGAAGIVVAVV